MVGFRIFLGFSYLIAITLVSAVSLRAESNAQAVSTTTSFSDDELQVLNEGEPVVRVEPDRSGRNAAAHIFGAVKIDASPEEVWATMVDCEQAPAFVPNLLSCEIIESDPKGAYDIRKHIISYSFVGLRVENIFRSDYVPFSNIAFRLVGGDLERQEGAWTLVASDDGMNTLVVYDAYVALGKPVPRFLVRRGMRKDMPEVLLALKRQVFLNKESFRNYSKDEQPSRREVDSGSE